MAQAPDRPQITVAAAETPERPVIMGVVNLGGDPIPGPGKDYDLVSASSDIVAGWRYPDSPYKRLSLDAQSFYVDDLPDWGVNEGLLKLSVDTKNPQDLNGANATVSYAIGFNAPDGSYAPGFLYRGVFRNVILTDWAILRFQLYELDTDLRDYYKQVKEIVDGIPELKSLDVLKGIPYLSLAAKLFDSIVMKFGVNPDDVIWGETPILEFVPTPGGAFLRTGIYVILEAGNSAGQQIDIRDFGYRDGKVVAKGQAALPNHLVVGMRVAEHVPG